MGLLLSLIEALLSSPNKSKVSNREREYNTYGLTEDEKKIAREEGYDPWDFEEEDMDEDSYYGDDS